MSGETRERISLGEKIGYGLGDTASNLIFQTIVNFIAFYYTDVVGMTPAVVGAIFLGVRVFDAVLDPVMGAVADRTRTRWGQFRPWILWLAIPFGLSAIAAFSVPALGGRGTALYVLVSYTVLMVFYTGVNIPYGALATTLTTDPAERTSVQSWRFALAMVGNLIVSSLTLPLVARFGGGDRALGYQLTMGVFALLGIVMLVACFAATRERAPVAPDAAPGRLGEDLKALWRNDQWRVLAGINFVLLVSLVMRGTVTLYFVTYVLASPDFATAYLTLAVGGTIVSSLAAGRMFGGMGARDWLLTGGAHAVLLAIFWAAGLLTGATAIAYTLAVAGVLLLCDLIGRRMGRVRAFVAVYLVQAALHAPLFFSPLMGPVASLGIYVAVMSLNQVGVPILWALMSDSVDYGQWKTGRRLTGLNFSTMLFALKMGVAVGGAAAAWVIAEYGYVANAAQSRSALTGIAIAFAAVPGAVALGVALLGTRIRLGAAEMERVQAALGLRGAAA